MKKFIFFIIAFLGAYQAFGQSYELVWSDEFDLDTVDAARWNFETGNGSNGWGNNEKEYYTERPENVRIDSGNLIITALKEDYMGFQYTSARMQTKNKAYWKYGRIEMRAKLPKGRGTWPAFWLLPQQQNYGTSYWPDNGEVDIMEYVGYAPGKVYGTVHTNKNNGSGGISQTISYAGVENDFHVYAIDWTPDEIKWYVDDYYYGSYQRLNRDWHYWPFDQPFFIIINFAVGGNWGGAQGIDDAIFPQTYEIDYIRVYQSPISSVSNNQLKGDDITVSPNPVNDFLIINIKNSITLPEISVYNSGGAILLSQIQYEQPRTRIDFSPFSSGIYIVLLKNELLSRTFKVIKQ